MGKSSLILVLGMTAIVAVILLKLNANSKEGLSTTVNMFEQTQARLIANSGVEIYLEKLKADPTMLNKTFPGNQLNNGTYDIQITGPDTLVTVKSTATFMGVTHTSVVKAAADKLPFFPVPSGMYIATEAVSGAKINGNILVSGFDHDINGNQLNNGNVLNGIGVDNNSNVTIIKNAVGGSADIEGLGGEPSVGVVSNTTNWTEYAMDVVSNPDIILNSNTNLSQIPNLGTLSSPKVTFVNGSVRFNSDLEGCGILVVNGDLEINGNFTYRGIVIAYKEAAIKTKLNGNGKVYGAMVIAGTSVDLTISNGNFKCLYSQESLNHVAGLLKTKRFRIISWWE
jgi:hypothetical protein